MVLHLFPSFFHYLFTFVFLVFFHLSFFLSFVFLGCSSCCCVLYNLYIKVCVCVCLFLRSVFHSSTLSRSLLVVFNTPLFFLSFLIACFFLCTTVSLIFLSNLFFSPLAFLSSFLTLFPFRYSHPFILSVFFHSCSFVLLAASLDFVLRLFLFSFFFFPFLHFYSSPAFLLL